MKIFKILAVTFFACGATLAMASAGTSASTAAVNKATCGKLVNTEKPFVLVLDKDDDLIDSITQCAKDAKLKGASVSGLGQLYNPVLAYFSSDPNAKPELTAFEGFYELASLNGNITNNAGKYYTHLHMVLADEKFRAIAGHVNSAKTGMTVEVTIVPFSASFQRTVDGKTGFGPIVH
jgi:predicted DNA-binding protein with PD1-like motif